MFLPVLGGTLEDSGERVNVHEAFGTAFAIGGGMYLTAGHVVEGALSTPLASLASPEDEGKRWGMHPIRQQEVFSPCDVAVLDVPTLETPALPWHASLLMALTDVISFGYAYGLDHQTRTLRLRAFKGHTVSARAFERLQANPTAYELSFQAPRGLSGAALVSADKTTIVGMVIGNSTTEMLVFSHREHLVDEGRDSTIERFEALTLGVAVTAQSLLEIEFELLGGRLGSHLAEQGLLSTG